MNCLIFMAGGSGVRFGADIPKQYIEIDGEPLFLYTLRKYCAFNIVDRIVIVSNLAWTEYTEAWAKRVTLNIPTVVVEGGETRSHSVKNGVLACSVFLREDDIVLIHDATNPFVDPGAVREGIELAKENGAAAIGTRQVHTIYNIDESGNIKGLIPRDNVSSGYSPEIFRFDTVLRIHKDADDTGLAQMTSAMALALQYGINVNVVFASVLNLKITYKDDLQYFLAVKKNEDETSKG